MALKSRKKMIAYAKEATYGQDGISADAPSYLLGRDFSVVPMAGDSTELDYDDGVLGQKGEIVTELYITIEFTVDFAASADPTKAAPWGDLMTACLRKVTEDTKAGGGADETKYAINEDALDSLTLYYYQDGTLHKALGARGSFSLSAAAKGFGGIKFTFTAMNGGAVAEALPKGDFKDWQTPLKVGVDNSAFSIDALPYKMISLEYDQANSVVYQEYVGQEEVVITDFKPTSTLVMEAPTIATLDVFALAKAGSHHEMIFTNGPIGNQVEWKCPKIQFGRPTYADQDGTLTISVPLIPIGNGDTFTTR